MLRCPASFISQITHGVMEEVKAWQNRPLESVYPIVYLDALVVRSRSSGGVENKSVYLALGINREGEKELPGLWLAPPEGTRFRLSVMTERKNRRLQDILLACTDGLKGFAQAIEAVYPQTRVATVYRTSGSPFSALCELETAQSGCR